MSRSQPLRPTLYSVGTGIGGLGLVLALLGAFMVVTQYSEAGRNENIGAMYMVSYGMCLAAAGAGLFMLAAITRWIARGPR